MSSFKAKPCTEWHCCAFLHTSQSFLPRSSGDGSENLKLTALYQNSSYDKFVRVSIDQSAHAIELHYSRSWYGLKYIELFASGA